MKKNTLTIASVASSILALSTLVSAPAVQAQGFSLPYIAAPSIFTTPAAKKRVAVNDFSNGAKLYVGASIGYVKQGDTCNEPFFNGTCSDSDMDWKVYGGARLNPMLGIEGSYGELGTASLDGQINGNDAHTKSTIKATTIAGVGYIPISAQIEAMGKVGVAFWESDSEKSGAGLTGTLTSQDKGQSTLLGAGAQYRLNQNIHIRGEWEHLFNVGSDSSYETDVDSYNLGFMYSTL